MRKPKFIKASNLPPRLNILGWLTWWLVLDYFKVPGWAYGVIFTFMTVVTLTDIWRLCAGDGVDLLGQDK